MPYFKTSAEWYEQSSLLLKARPTTTRITSKYSVLKPSPSLIRKRQKYAAKTASRHATAKRDTSPPTQLPNPEEVTSTFTLKTYDPESGTCLQYETTKAAEVGRLIGSLGRLGRGMAALPNTVDDLSVPAGSGEGIATPRVEETDVNIGGAPATPAGATGGAGGGKRKKKGKK